MRRALISIGTNSTRLLIVDGDAVVAARSVGTRLGRGLDRAGRLDPAAVEATLAAIRDYVGLVHDQRASIDAIATSALRRAVDAGSFVAGVSALAGVAPRIISGDEEARYSFLGATWGRASAGRVGVLDVGGGSTELAIGTPPEIERTISLEIGAVRLAERFPAILGERGLDADAGRELVARARTYVSQILAPLETFAVCEELIGVGGSVFTAAAMIAHDPTRDGVRIDRIQRRAMIDELLARDLRARRELAHIRPQRADILPAGLIVVDVACEALAIDSLRVSHADLLAGYLRSPQYRSLALSVDPDEKEDRAEPESKDRGMG